MVRNIAEFEYIVTDNEMEALILEGNLIKKYSPRYNILLKDDKFYPFIKITTNDDFPRVFVTRNYAKDGNRYFGPYTSGTAVYETVTLIHKIFPLRTCKRLIIEGGEETRPCLYYQLNQCKAPCAGYISKKEYGEMIESVIQLLNGKNTTIVKELKKDMEEAAESLDFEKAASLRDKIAAVETIAEKQKIFTSRSEDEDFINLYSDEKDTCVEIFFVREGKVNGREHFTFENTAEDSTGEIIQDFLMSFYGGTALVPKHIYVPELVDIELMEELLSAKKGSKVAIKVPQKGEKKDLLDMVSKNAKITLEQFKTKLLQDKEINRVSLEEMANVLDLAELPRRIEAFDISNIQGLDSVGTMVVFEEGKPKNSDYRRFRIKTVQGANDYDSMREILTRRFQHGLDEIKAIQETKLELSKGKFMYFPDLILMDGGKGQVNVALEVLQTLNIDIPVCGMVKDDKHRTRGLIYNNEELFIAPNSNLMHMITRIQDEVHRYAITYHRSLRDKRTLHSILEDIPFIGEKRRRNLLMKFGSVDNIKKASLEELLETPSIDRKAAESIKSYFKNTNNKNG